VATVLTIFLSSTSKDLVQCREAAYRAIEGLHGYHCVRMEDFGAVDEVPDDFCRARVAECDLFLCIVGPLYGSHSPAVPSYTEREFRAAVLHQKPSLVFVTAEDYPLAANLIESDQDRQYQAAFRQEVMQGRIVTRFSTPEQASVKVVQAIRNWEAMQNANAKPTQASLLASQLKPLSYRVAVLNRSTRLTDDEVRAAVGALQTQVHRDFAPAWGVDAELAFVPLGTEPEPESWWVVVEDESDYPEAIAYHTLTSEGLPQVKISVANAQQFGWPWTMAASHDLLEMLANPQLNLTVFVSRNDQTGRLYRREICDPVSAPELGYSIDGVVVSNFVHPAWFESSRKPGSTKFDQGGHVSEPFMLAPGGYVNLFNVLSGSGWHPEWKPAAKKASPKKASSKKASSKRNKPKS
jgi:hypothetical protein